MDDTPLPTVPPPARPAARAVRRTGDLVLLGLSRGAGITLLVVMAAIAVFLTTRSVTAISGDHGDFLTTFAWNTNSTPPVFGIAVLAYGTIVSSALALLAAVPVSIGVALFTTHYAPRRVSSAVDRLVDLLAAVPSIVYGLWGALYLVPHLAGPTLWMDQHLGWTVILQQTHDGTAARSLFTVGILLAVMIVPIVTSVSREVIRQTPRAHEEAALALGATRWEVIRLSVLPFARSGLVSAAMLGLGRALGETMAVATVLSSSPVLSAHLTDPGGGTLAQNIAAHFGEATDFGRDALIASGLVLFAITLLVNGAARLIITRRRPTPGAAA